MLDHERYDAAVRRLAQYNYEVIADGQGYLVRHTTDTNDVSQARNLVDLVDLAELVEWKQRQERSA